MKLPRRIFLHLAAGAAALPAVSRAAWAQAYPARLVSLVGNPSIIELLGSARTSLARRRATWL